MDYGTVYPHHAAQVSAGLERLAMEKTMDTRNVVTLLVLGMALGACTGDNSSSSSGGSSGTSGDPTSSSAASGSSGSQSASTASASASSSGGNSGSMNISSSSSGVMSSSGQQNASSSSSTSSGNPNMGTLGVWNQVPGDVMCDGLLGPSPGTFPLVAGVHTIETVPAPSAVPRLHDYQDVMIEAGQMTSFYGATAENPHIDPVDMSHGAADLVVCIQSAGSGASGRLTIVRETRPEYLKYGRWRAFGPGLVGPVHIDGFTLSLTCDPDGCGAVGTIAADDNSFTVGGATNNILDRSACN